MSGQKFLFDRDQRGTPLELLIAQDLYDRQIPFGFNPHSGTEHPAREDFDIYVGQPSAPLLLLETKMDWHSGLTGNIFIEEKTLRNTKANRILYGRLILDVFDTDRLRQMYEERLENPTWDDRRAAWQMYRYKHVSTGGDQANNPGMLLGWKDVKENSHPYWRERLAIQQLIREV
jgi:hypothetical protein